MGRTQVMMAAVALMAAGTGASAQGISHATGGLSSSLLTEGGDTSQISGIDASVGAEIGVLDLFGEFSLTEVELESTRYDLGTLGGGLGLQLSPEFRFDLSYLEFENSVFGIPEQSGAGEVGLTYGAGALSLRGAYASLEDGSGADAIYGALLAFRPFERTDTAISAHRIVPEGNGDPETLAIATFDREGILTEIAVDAILAEDFLSAGATGRVAVTPLFGLSGSAARVSADNEPDVNRWGLGAYFEVFDALRLDTEFFRLDTGDDEATGLTVGLSFDIGFAPVARQTQVSRLNRATQRSFGLDF